MLVAQCRLGSAPSAAEWTAGLLPVNASDPHAERELRASYFERAVSAALYGSGTPRAATRSGRRWHRLSPAEAPPAEGVEVLAAELLLVPAPAHHTNAALAVHCRVTGSPFETLRSLTTLGSDGGDESAASRAWYTRLLGGDGTLAVDARRAFCASLVIPESELSDLYEGAPQRPPWKPNEQWLFHLASATDPRRFPVDPAAQDLAEIGSKPRLSASWEALVLRDGAAFLLDVRVADADFLSAAERYFRSVYLDTFLLGAVQRARLEQLADDLADLEDPTRSVEPLLALHREVSTFRNTYWWRHATPHGIGNALLHGYQEQHRLPERASEVFEELAEYSEQARIAEARRQSEAVARGNALIGLVTVVALPFSIALGVVQALVVPDWAVVLACALAVVTSLVLAWSPPGKAVLRPLRRITTAPDKTQLHQARSDASRSGQ